MNYPEKVAARAADIRAVSLLLSLLALPFFVIGFVVGILWLAIRWSYAALLIGFEQVATSAGTGDDAG